MIILGSSSPRRIEYLTKLNYKFKIIKPIFNERSFNSNSKEDYSSFLAFKKLESILLNNKDLNLNDDLIITFDTSIFKDGVIFNKPLDLIDAYNTLKYFSNSNHEVITGFAIYYKNQIIIDYDITKVYFNELSDNLINKYINDKKVNVLDKAGSYAIQYDNDYHLIKKIEGNLDNVIGFPSLKIKYYFDKLNYKE